MLDALSHPMLYVTDVVGTAAWYGEVLGFQPMFVTEHYASLRHPKAGRLDLHGAKVSSEGKGTVPQYRVADIDAVVAALRDRGVAVDDPRREGESSRFTSFQDPEGNWLGLEEAR